MHAVTKSGVLVYSSEGRRQNSIGPTHVKDHKPKTTCNIPAVKQSWVDWFVVAWKMETEKPMGYYMRSWQRVLIRIWRAELSNMIHLFFFKPAKFLQESVPFYSETWLCAELLLVRNISDLNVYGYELTGGVFGLRLSFMLWFGVVCLFCKK